MEQPGGSEGNERSNPIDGNVSKGAGGGWGGLPQPFKDDDIIGRESYPLPVAFKDKHVYQVGPVSLTLRLQSV